MQTYVAIKELPQGQQPGTVLALPPEIGGLFVSVGAARLATASEKKSGVVRASGKKDDEDKADDEKPGGGGDDESKGKNEDDKSTETATRRSGRHYNRRDLTAAESEE